jgi:hypothetical protein
MDDMILKTEIDSQTTLYVSPIAPETYAEQIEDDNLGGGSGYFVLRECRIGLKGHLEILAKAPSFEAAGALFDMFVSAGRRVAI